MSKYTVFSEEECKELFNIIDQLSGGNPEYVFDVDRVDCTKDPRFTACVKLYVAVGRVGLIPKDLITGNKALNWLNDQNTGGFR